MVLEKVKTGNGVSFVVSKSHKSEKPESELEGNALWELVSNPDVITFKDDADLPDGIRGANFIRLVDFRAYKRVIEARLAVLLDEVKDLREMNRLAHEITKSAIENYNINSWTIGGEPDKE